MAARNGYKAEQSSDLYITDGDQIDWMYGKQRIFSFTWELYPTETPTVWGDHYPPDEKIAPQTARNRVGAALLPDRRRGLPVRCDRSGAGRLRAVLRRHRDQPRLEGQPGRHRHGAGRRPGSPAAIRSPTTYNGLRIQPNGTASGRYAFVTGLKAGSSINVDDLDGRTTIRSVPITMPATRAPASSSSATCSPTGGSAADTRQALRRGRPGARTQVWSVAGSSATVGAGWRTARVDLSSPTDRTIRLVFQATDGGAGTLMEVGIDDVRVERAAT